MLDPRRNKPSASGIRRVANCKGSHKREQQCPQIESADATFGTRVAAAMAGTMAESELTLAERQTFEKCVDAEERILAEWQDHSPKTITREVRLGLTSFGTVVEVTPDCKADIIFTGQYDFLAIQRYDPMPCRALLKDDKALYGDIADAVDNEQIMALAVLVWIKHRPSHLTGAIVQPNMRAPTMMEMDETTFPKAFQWLISILLAARISDIDGVNPWTPDKGGSDWCRYCRARTDCAEWRDRALQPIEVMQPMQNAALDSKAMWGAMSAITGRMSDGELVARYQGMAMVKAYPAVIEAEMQRRATEVEGFPYELRATREKGNRVITDPEKAFQAVEPLGVTHEAFLKCLQGVSIGPLEDAVRKASGVKSAPGAKVTKYNLTAAKAKETLNAALGDVLQYREAPLELVPVQQRLEETNHE